MSDRDPRERRHPHDGPLAADRGGARDRGRQVAGGVGVHETALASPETIDLGGLTVLPGFTDSHVHFAQWSLAQRQVRLEGDASLDDAVARVAAAAKDAPPDRWLRGIGWRSGDVGAAGRADAGRRSTRSRATSRSR